VKRRVWAVGARADAFRFVLEVLGTDDAGGQGMFGDGCKQEAGAPTARRDDKKDDAHRTRYYNL
jgi:hypothetical protein